MTWYVVDGMDGSGKSTVGDLINDRLRERGRRVMYVTHPNSDCFWGRQELKFLHIDSTPATIMVIILYIIDVVCSLFRAKRHRKDYDDFVFVRYIMAVSYLPEGMVRKGYLVISKILPMPDVKIFVDVDGATAMARIEARSEDREAFEEVDKLDKVRRKMQMLADDGWYTVDNMKSPEHTAEQVDTILEKERENEGSYSPF
ncbi:MAG: thymidylate kinase [Thermoplasmata archaeon]|nr:thymidylate kinase [Thermoplasmata archaeon]